MTSPAGKWACGYPHGPLTPFWKYFRFSQQVHFRRAWNLLSFLLLKCGPLSTVTHIVINVMGWVSLALMKSHFMTKKLFIRTPWGRHLATTWDLILDPWKWPSGNQAACFHPRSGGRTTVVRTCWYAMKNSKVSLQNNCQSSKRGSSFQRPRFKRKAYAYTFFLAYYLCLRWSVFIYKTVLPRLFSSLPKRAGKRTFTFYFLLLEYENTQPRPRPHYEIHY